MFNATQHRGNPNMGPAAGGQPNHRLNEIFDSLRAEFDNQNRSSEQYESQVAQQIQEMELIRNKVYQLEQNQLKIKQDYENEIRALRHELDMRGGAPPVAQSHIGGPLQHGGPSQPPPALGHGNGGLFSGIMANQGQGGPGLAPPPEQPPQQQHQLQPPPPAGQPQGPPQPPNSFPGYQPGPTLNGYQQPPNNSPGLGKNRNIPNRGPGPATPQQHPGQPQPGPYQNDPRASPQMPRPTPPGHDLAMSRQHQLPGHSQIPHVGNTLAELDVDTLPDSLKRVGSDWFAVFNPAVPRLLDVRLEHNLVHESVVCCVRFSADGKYVATGCNRSAQIFDAHDGRKICELQDNAVADKEGDLYIRSVCFSPDGKLLATGAEDRRIRVWDIETRRIRNTFDGHDQDIYSLDFSKNGHVIASGSGDKTVRLWDINTNQQMMVLSIEDGVTTVAMSPDGRYVAAGSLDKSVRVWECVTGYLAARLEGPQGHKDSVYSVAFSPTGRELVSGSLDKTIKMWELGLNMGPHGGLGPSGNTGKCIRTFEGHKVCHPPECTTAALSRVLTRNRITYFRSASRRAASGSCLAAKIVEFSSGILPLAMHR